MKYEIILQNGQRATIEAADDKELNEKAGRMNVEIFWRDYNEKIKKGL